jgi:peroxiredoxin
MDEMGGDLLQAEQFLKDGNKQAALPLLMEYVRRNPGLARGWWVLSFAVADPQQQIECLERVLRIDPNSVQAQTRLQKIRGESESQSHLTEPDRSPEKTLNPPSQPVLSQTPKVKKKAGVMLPLAVLSICIVAGVFGLVIAFPKLSQASLFPIASSNTPIPAVPQITFPATWTPTVTIQPTATNTFVPAAATSDFNLLETATVDLPNFDDWLAPGMQAPDFTMENIANGQTVTLSDYKDHPVVIFFFVTWCGFCDGQVPALKRIQEDYEDQGLIILAVDVGESEAKANSFRKKYDLSFPVLNDPERELFQLYKGSRYPTTYFIDTEGKVSTSMRGMMDYTSLTIRVSVLLNKISTPVP